MKLSLIQVARGVAALLVIMHHLIANCTNHLNYIAFNNFFNFGFVGVDFFFVLSGFIITYIHFDDLNNSQPGKISVFFKKRFVRIYPIYWIIAFVTMLVYVKHTPAFMQEIGLEMNFASPRTQKFLFESFLLLPNEDFRLVGVAWTLSYELLFYIVFGISIMMGMKTAKIIAVSWVMLIVLFSFVHPFESQYFRFFFSILILEFLGGCVVGYAIRKNLNIKISYLLIPLTIFSIMFINDFHMVGLVYHRNIYNVTLLSFIFSIITYIIVRIDQANPYFKYPPILMLIGDASYSIYLSHNIFLSGFTRAYARFNPNFSNTGYLALVALIISVVTIFIGILIHLFIEKKLMKILNEKFIYTKPVGIHSSKI